MDIKPQRPPRSRKQRKTRRNSVVPITKTVQTTTTKLSPRKNNKISPELYNDVILESATRKPGGSRNQSYRGSYYERVAFALAAPSMAVPVRWNSSYSVQPTAIAAPWRRFDTPWAAGATPTNDLPNDLSQMFVFREAERAYVNYDANPGGDTYGYQLRYRDPQGSNNAQPTFILETGIPTELPLIAGQAASVYQPHGSILYAGAAANDQRCLWMQGDTIIAMQVNNATATGVELIADRWFDGIILEEARVAGVFAGGTCLLSLPLTKNGYYALRMLTTGAGGATTIESSSFAANKGVWCHHALPFYENNNQSVDAWRILAASAMYTNDAAALQRAGKCVGAQLPEGEDWQKFTGSLDAVSQVAGSYQDDVVQGIYGFLRPTKPDDFNFRTYIDFDDNVLVNSSYPLKSTSSFVTLMLAIPNAADQQSGYWTVAHSVEFLSTDVWRPLSAPVTPRDTYDQALDNLKNFAQFTRNANHLKAIAQSIGKGLKGIVKGAQKYIPKVMDFVEDYGPVATEIANLAGSVI